MSWRKPVPWTAEEDAKLKALLAEGLKTGAAGDRLGRSETSVISRLRSLERKAARAALIKRKCMCCHKEFLSAGHHNRLCGVCRRQDKTPFDF